MDAGPWMGSWNKSRGNLSKVWVFVNKNTSIPVHQFSERYHTNVRCYQVENGVGHAFLCIMVLVKLFV